MKRPRKRPFGMKSLTKTTRIAGEGRVKQGRKSARDGPMKAPPRIAGSARFVKRPPEAKKATKTWQKQKAERQARSCRAPPQSLEEVVRRRAQKLAKTRHRHPRRIILKPFVRLTKSHLFPRGIDAYAELKTHDPRNTENAQNRQGKKARKSLKKILYREQQTRREAEWRAKAEGLEIARQFREAVREDIRKERAALVFEPRRPIWGKYPATMQQPRP